MIQGTQIQQAFEQWYAQLPVYQGGLPAKGTIAGALVVLDRLKENFDLSINAHTAKGKSQIAGAGRAALQRILASFGEVRPLLREGGRTNRGLRGDIESMLNSLSKTGLSEQSPEARNAMITDLQRFLVRKVQEIHSRERLKIVYDHSQSTYQFVRLLLAVAQATGQQGAVAEYLVGAKLQLRFPSLTIENKISSAADQQRGKAGDFRIGDTVFHVTVAPGPLLYEKCMANINNGLKAYLVVPEAKVLGTKQNADDIPGARITVTSIEAFVSQNIDEISVFDPQQQKHQLAALLTSYNQRVDAVETDKSLLIEIPTTLVRS
jgi:Domain of unknown function (DUF4928)